MLETKHAARRITALPATPPAARPSQGSIALQALEPAARFSLRLDEASAKDIGVAAGFALDAPINRFKTHENRHAMRLGPNEWLLIAPEADAESVHGQIEAALAGHFYSLVDIGHRNVGIAVSGPRAADVLNAGCPLDLDAKAFPTGSATRTLLGKAEIVLMRTDDAPTYRVECWRSFSTYVWDFLAEAAREFDSSSSAGQVSES